MSNSWCKFDSIDMQSYIIGLCTLMAQLMLLIVYIRSKYIAYKLDCDVSHAQKIIKRLMLLWFIVSFTKSVLNAIGYPMFIRPHNPQYEAEIIMSAVCLYCDRMSSFLLHSILLRIPCIWIKNTVYKLQDNDDLSIKDRKKINTVFTVINLMNIYLIVRRIIALIYLSFVVTMCFYPVLGDYSKYLTVITMFECTVSISIYTFGVFTMLRFRSKLPLPQKIYSRLVIQYIILLTCCLARLTFNSIQYFIRSTVYEADDDCSDKHPQSNVPKYIYLSLGYFMMHIIPILSLMIIYWPEVPDSWESSRDILMKEDSKQSSTNLTQDNYHSLD